MSSRRGVALLLLIVILGSVGAATLAFGAVYEWVYAPLALVSAVAGLSAILVSGRRPPLAPVAICFGAIAVAIALQLVPLPRTLLLSVSPGTDQFLSRYDLAYAAGGALSDSPEDTGQPVAPPSHPTSIAPERTRTALLLFLAFALLALGTARVVSVVGAHPVARAMVVFGLALAIIGIVQYALHAPYRRPENFELQPLIYGFWRPELKSQPFGPFVNPNHFAGWMLMVLPIALGLFYERALRLVEVGRARRVYELSLLNTPDFSAAMYFALCAVVMGLALLLTRSRSAAGAFAVASIVAGWVVLRALKDNRARLAAGVGALLLFGGTIAWAGADSVLNKVRDQGTTSIGGRADAWRGALAIAKDFPVAGSGLDTYGLAMIFYQQHETTMHYNEAHNDYLQLLAEGGLLVMIPIAVTVMFFIREVRRRFREAPKVGTTYWVRVGAVIGIVGIALQSCFEFSLQMPANAALFAVLVGLALHQSPNLRPSRASAGS
jgi:hypothetical protein